MNNEKIENREAGREPENHEELTRKETVSIVLPFETIDNIRDLGGISADEGKALIRPGRLFRSAELAKASKHDIRTLDLMGLKKVFDLRTEWEVAAKPDRLSSSWILFHEPVLHESTLSSAFGSELNFARVTMADMEKTMKEAYVLMVSSKRAQKTWKKLFSEMLKEDSPILFHCTEGKDRTGMAAALIEHALGVPEDLIVRDYLDTNRIAAPLIGRDEQLAKRLNLMKEEQMRENVEDFIEAKPEYYEAANRWILDNYDSWQGYLQGALGLCDEDLERLRELWLRPLDANL